VLQLEIPKRELFDDSKSEFITIKQESLQLEHSLVSLSKWESKWCKPFLGNIKSTEETIDYIRCMTITQNVRPEVYSNLPDIVFKQVEEYVNAPMTATWFADTKSKSKSSEAITAELIYYWMIALTIPIECQKWHLNKLLTLVRICNIKNQPPKKKGRRETLADQSAINRARREKYNTKG